MDSDASADYKLKLKRAAIDVKRLDDGTLIMRSPVISMARWFESTHSQNLGLQLPGSFAPLLMEGDVASGEDGEVYALHLMGPAPDGQALHPDDAGKYTDTG